MSKVSTDCVKVLRSLLLIIFLSVSIKALPQELVINEIMSSNTMTLADEDGDFSDWLEIYNYGATPVNLNGYGLSDNNSVPYMWIFPDITIQAGDYLVVFASDKDRKDMPANYNTIIDWGDQWKYRFVESQPPADWNEIGFDDSGWYDGPSGFGYGDGDDATVINNARTVYLRKTFDITDASGITSAILHMDYDDGFVAFINGIEISRAAMGTPGSPTYWDVYTDYDHEALIYQGGTPERFDIDLSGGLLQNGTNVLAIEVHNVSATSSDFTAIPFLTVGGPGITPGYVAGILNLIDETYLHTNFKISSSGDSLILTSSTSQVVDEIFTDTITADISLGRKPDGTDNWYYFGEPTPGGPNTTYAHNAVTHTLPVASHPGGLYTGALNLTLTSPFPGDTIYYTLDGTLPDITSDIYTSAINISGTTMLRARIIRSNEIPAAVLSSTYIYFERECNLPVLSVFTDPYNLWDVEYGIYAMGNDASSQFPHFGANFWEDWERPAHIELYETDGTQKFSVDAGIKIFGGWSRGNPQKSLSVFARRKYGDPSINSIVFEDKAIPQFEALVFRNSGNDWMNTMFRDGMLTSLVRNLDIDVQAFRPAVMFLNGEYWGIHNIREKVNEHYVASNHNVDADSVELLENNGDPIVGSGQHYAEMIDFVSNNNLAITSNYEHVKTLMDVDNFIKYELSQIYFNNQDWPGNNIKFWRSTNNGGKWRWILYDTDFGFGIWNVQDYLENTLAFALEPNGTGWPNPAWSTLLLRKLTENTTFRNSFINQFADHLNTTFQPDAVVAHINSIADKLDPEIYYHYPHYGESYNNWEGDVENMKTFAEYRVPYVRDHIQDQFSLPGTRNITVNAQPAGTGQVLVNTVFPDSYPWNGIYFRDVPIELKAIPKEGYRFTGWTGDIESEDWVISADPAAYYDFTAHFEEDFSTLNPIVFNEINYNSHPSFNTGDWVELYNRSDQAVDLSSWIFKDSEDIHIYVIPNGTVLAPGNYFVLCRDLASFTSHYPEISSRNGNFNFGLSSEGECIRLYSNTGQLEDSVYYGVLAPWPSEPCGNGPTLELIDPFLDNTLASSWTASVLNGTPGTVNNQYVNIPEISTGEAYSQSPVSIYPNPFRTTLNILINMSYEDEARLSVYNINGELKHVITYSGSYEGTHNITWDGRDEYGNRLPDGLYLIRIETDNYQTAEKVLFLK
ncbi:MAG: CotH kinase family protein [Bacteroidales bacterium]|nr:MAG: CotH kinase family protein [Bacteroidales bacterium]